MKRTLALLLALALIRLAKLLIAEGRRCADTARLAPPGISALYKALARKLVLAAAGAAFTGGSIFARVTR